MIEAVKGNLVKTVRLLLKKSVNINAASWNLARGASDKDIAQLLLNHEIVAASKTGDIRQGCLKMWTEHSH